MQHQKKHQGRESQAIKNNQQQRISEQHKKGKRTKKENHWEIVMGEEEYVDKGAVNPTKQKWLKRMWNKHIEMSWGFVLE